MAARVKVTIRLSDEAHAGLVRACQASGISMTALFEAIGCDLHTEPRRLLDRGADIIEAARAIEQENRRRR